jgi:hypothetical protein
VVIDTIVHMVYRAETLMHRQIEKNDGKRIVEVRTFVDCKAVKVTSTVEISFRNLAPGLMFLSNLFLGDNTLVGTAVALGLDAVRGWITHGIQRELDARNTKVRGAIDGLTGKKVRIVFEDGKGVVELTPIDCSLTKEQQDFLLAAAVVTDAYWLPDVESRPGQTWSVPGEALSDLVPPSWKAVPEGSLTIRRERDFERDGKQYALLRLERGSVTVNATDARRSRLGSLTPEGSLEYNITDGHVSKAELTAKGSIQEVSRDHLLFESRFEAAPKVRMTYSCRILP